MEKLLVDRVEQEFLRDINANVTDDGVRLIYADYLEDHGEPERAEFIRLQIKRFQEQLEAPHVVPVYERELELWKTHAREWYQDLASFLRWVAIVHFIVDDASSTIVLNDCLNFGSAEVERGFVYHITCSIEDFDRRGKWLGGSFPLQSLCLADVKPVPSHDLSFCRFWVCQRYATATRRLHMVPDYFYPTVTPSSYVDYATEQEAMADLTRRALNWAKGIPNE